jgi:short-subunit dehydrogenase
MGAIQNKTVLITGASSGIGRAAAKYFQQRGWNVAATMRKPEAEKELNRLAHVECIALDVCSTDSIGEGIEKAIECFGKIDVVVNNAGVYVIGPFEASSESHVKLQFDTSLFGVMNVTKKILPHFRQNNGGTLINISSIAGRTVSPMQSLYHGAKYAIEGFSESLQYEVRPFNIHIKLIEPGVIKTGFSDPNSNTAVVMRDELLPEYMEYADKVTANLIKMNAQGSDPMGVARVIYTASTDNKKKLIYPAGKSARAMLCLRRILPRTLFYRMVEGVLMK